jgi:hypothetical protein
MKQRLTAPPPTLHGPKRRCLAGQGSMRQTGAVWRVRVRWAKAVLRRVKVQCAKPGAASDREI